MGRRRSRRVKYYPEYVVLKVLSSSVLLAIAKVVYSSSVPLRSGDIASEVSRVLGEKYSASYVSVYLKRLEKWGVVRPYRDPNSGKLLWFPASTKTAELVAEALKKEEAKSLIKVIDEVELW